MAVATFATATPALAQSPEPEDDWFGVDKALHFAAGAGLSAGGYALGAWAFENRWGGVGLGAGMGLLVGAAKEGIDAAGAGDASYKDFVWTALGTVLGIGVSITFDAALRGPLE